MPCHAILNQRAQIVGNICALFVNPQLLDALAQAIARLLGEPVAISSVTRGPCYWDAIYNEYLHSHQIIQPWPTSQVDTRAGIDISASRGCVRIEPDGTCHIRGGHNTRNYYTEAEAAELLPQAQTLVQTMTMLATQALIVQRLRAIGTLTSINSEPRQGIMTLTLDMHL